MRLTRMGGGMVIAVQCAVLIAPYVHIAPNVLPEGEGELSRCLVPHPSGC